MATTIQWAFRRWLDACETHGPRSAEAYRAFQKLLDAQEGRR